MRRCCRQSVDRQGEVPPDLHHEGIALHRGHLLGVGELAGVNFIPYHREGKTNLKPRMLNDSDDDGVNTDEVQTERGLFVV
jgi:hypothetical protein